MKKTDAIKLLGGTTRKAADALKITTSAVNQWPEELTAAIENRVLAELYRKRKKRARVEQ